MPVKTAMEIIADKVAFAGAVLLTLFALWKGWKEYLEAWVKVAKEKSTGASKIQTIEEANRKITEEVEWLKKNSSDNAHDIERLENDFKDIMKRLMEFHFKS